MLAAALALHGALVLALGLSLSAPASRPMSLQAAGEQAVLQVRTLAPEARSAGVAEMAADILPQPAVPSLGLLPAPAMAMAGELSRQGSRLQFAYPDIELAAPRVTVSLSLRIDGTGRLLSARPVPGQPAPEALLQHVQEDLAGARLDGVAGSALPAGLCLHVRFDAEETAVAWWFESPDPRGRCGTPGYGAPLHLADAGR